MFEAGRREREREREISPSPSHLANPRPVNKEIPRELLVKENSIDEINIIENV
jgi:hypothetical protein